MTVAKESNKKEDDKTVTTPSALKAPSLPNLLLVYLACLGLGAIAGYRVFASIYNNRCSDMIDEAEHRFDMTREELKNQLKEALEKKCDLDESEVLELHGRFVKQEALIEDLGKQEKQGATALLHMATQYNEQYKDLLADYQKKMLDMESKLRMAAVEKESMEKRIQEANIKDKEEEKELSAVHIQRLHTALVQEKFGEGPYFVQFDVHVDDENDPAVLLVEVSTSESLPTAVFNFLTLVDSGVYQEAEFLSTQSILHLDSDEEKVNSLGYAISGLRLVEDSSLGICAPYSVGFVGANGGLKFIMTNDISKHGTLACFGRIAQGRQTLTLIQRAAKDGKAIAVTGVRIVGMGSPPSVKEGEL